MDKNLKKKSQFAKMLNKMCFGQNIGPEDSNDELQDNNIVNDQKQKISGLKNLSKPKKVKKTKKSKGISTDIIETDRKTKDNDDTVQKVVESGFSKKPNVDGSPKDESLKGNMKKKSQELLTCASPYEQQGVKYVAVLSSVDETTETAEAEAERSEATTSEKKGKKKRRRKANRGKGTPNAEDENSQENEKVSAEVDGGSTNVKTIMEEKSRKEMENRSSILQQEAVIQSNMPALDGANESSPSVGLVDVSKSQTSAKKILEEHNSIKQAMSSSKSFEELFSQLEELQRASKELGKKPIKKKKQKKQNASSDSQSDNASSMTVDQKLKSALKSETATTNVSSEKKTVKFARPMVTVFSQWAPGCSPNSDKNGKKVKKEKIKKK